MMFLRIRGGSILGAKSGSVSGANQHFSKIKTYMVFLKLFMIEWESSDFTTARLSRLDARRRGRQGAVLGA